MRYRCVLVLLILLLSLTCTALGAEEKLKIKNSDGEIDLKPLAYNQSKRRQDSVLAAMACLLKNEPTSCGMRQG